MSTDERRRTGEGSADASTDHTQHLLSNQNAHAPRLIENVDHHLRTPLTVILAHIDLWLDRARDFPVDLQESLAAVARAGWRVRDVGAAICDLIDLTSIAPEPAETVQVWELAQEQTAVLGDRAARREIELRLEGEPTTHWPANRARLGRALGELLDNALTYAPDRSTVVVTVTGDDSGVRITVTDEGEGIEPADRDRLLRPFERGTHPDQAVDGLGMGLAVAGATAASHGGRLILEGGPRGGLLARLELGVIAASQTPSGTGKAPWSVWGTRM